jgi:vitamin B12/bleomycin/antimicrobial peptide transport system ATP-binding/permease protein
VLAYPYKADKFSLDAYGHALERLGLERLAGLLDTTRRWDRDLSQDEQLALSFARIQLQVPAWVLIDDTLGSLDDEARERIVDVFHHELARTSVIHIGRAAEVHDPLFTRVLHLIKTPAKPGVRTRAADGTGAIAGNQASGGQV